MDFKSNSTQKLTRSNNKDIVDLRGLILVLVVSLILLLVNFFFPKTLFVKQFSRIVTQYSIPVIEIFKLPLEYIEDKAEGFSNLYNLQTKYTNLQKENEYLRFWVAEAMRLKKQISEIERLAKLKFPVISEYIIAQVVAEVNGPFQNSMLVNIGLTDGVKEGDAVITHTGLLGYILDTFSNSSRVLLLTDINSQIPIKLEDIELEAIMVGRGDELPLLKYIKSSDGIVFKNGTKVLTSGAGGVLPKDVLVGTVKTDNNGNYVVKLFSNSINATIVTIVRHNFIIETKASDEVKAKVGDEVNNGN